jgi:hypothetical protein
MGADFASQRRVMCVMCTQAMMCAVITATIIAY